MAHNTKHYGSEEEARSSTLTRRTLLRNGGYLVAATALSPVIGAVPAMAEPAPAAGPAISPVMQTLSAYMAAARDRALPGEVAEQAKFHVLDTLCAMVSGAQLPPGKLAIEFAAKYGGEKVATVAASPVRCGAIEAALANGMLAHSDETDDSHAPSFSHPGAAVIPAALACGEQFGISGDHFLRAVTLGYDIGPRFTMTLGGVGYSVSSHLATHAFATNFGAAAAAGSAASLNARQMRWMIDYAVQQNSGTMAWQRDTDHIQKSLVFAGIGARNGVTAALLIQMGATGVDDTLSGADNFFLAYQPKADPNRLIEKLGERYEVVRTNIKKWTVGSPIQAPLDAVEILMKRHGFKADDVRKVVVHVATNEATVVNNREIPDICLQHMIAVMLLDGTASFAAAHDTPRMKDPAVLRQRAKVQLVWDDELERRKPAREAIVIITLANGTEVSHHVKAVRGTAENPMTRPEVVDKCRDLATPVLGAPTAGKLIERVMEIEKVKNIREIGDLLRRG